MRRSCGAVLALLLAAASAGAQGARGPADGAGMAPTDTARVHAGMLAPDFTLEAFTGPDFTLSALRGRKQVILVFYRGHW